MPRRPKWSAEEKKKLLELYTGSNAAELAVLFDRSESAIISMASNLDAQSKRLEARDAEFTKDPKELLKGIHDANQADQLLIEENAKLRQELATLRAQKTWSDHAVQESSTGGTLTIFKSDEHNADLNHLLGSAEQLRAKVITLVDLYKPDKIQVIDGGDLIAGAGIYRNQDLDSVTSNVAEQAQIAAVKQWELLSGIRTVSDAPISWRQFKGNHEVGGGQDLTELIFWGLQSVLKGIENLECKYLGSRGLINLADDGIYNVFATHGFGGSNFSPNSPAFINAVKDTLLDVQHRLTPEEHPHRVLSGHTHWYSIGIARTVHLFFDTAGGLQRNTRIKIGSNQRACGWIAYHSPKGSNEILKPIGIEVDKDDYLLELEDPNLPQKNRVDAAKCLTLYREVMEGRKEYEATLPGMPSDGRY